AKKRSAVPHKLKIQTAPTAQEKRLFRATVAKIAKSPAMKSPKAAGAAKEWDRRGETTPGTRKLKPINRRNMWGATRRASAVLRSFARSHGHTYSAAIVAELARLDSTLSPNTICTFISFPPFYEAPYCASALEPLKGIHIYAYTHIYRKNYCLAEAAATRVSSISSLLMDASPSVLSIR